MRNVAVIEDEKSASDALGQHLKRYGAETGEEFKIYVFPDAETFLQNYKADYDVVFMDIELPGMNGMTAARELRKLDGKVVLVFVTNMSQFAVGGYEVGAFDFILKPVNYSSFFLKFTRIMEKVKSNDDLKIIIRGKEVAKRVFSSDIMYVEVVNHALTYHLCGGNVTALGTMKNVREQLGSDPAFVLCNQSYLVNLKCHDLKYQVRQIAQGNSGNHAFEEIENLISVYDSMIKTGNEALDVIFTEKSLICRKNGIRLNCMVDGARLSFMDKTDIYVLFGNLVDNAMEAVQKLDDMEKRIISLNVFAENGVLAVNMSNYYEGELVLRDDGLPATTKTDKNFHGLGVKSVCMIVEKYKGDINFSADNGIFRVGIVFPLP